MSFKHAELVTEEEKDDAHTAAHTVAGTKCLLVWHSQAQSEGSQPCRKQLSKHSLSTQKSPPQPASSVWKNYNNDNWNSNIVIKDYLKTVAEVEKIIMWRAEAH